MNRYYFNKEKITDFQQASKLEWLETNGLGGWASSTVSGAHTRRYHGLLVAALHPPLGRIVVLSKLDETIITGDKRIELGTNQYPGAIYPQGYQQLASFQRDIFPEFIYETEGIQLKKTIAAIQGENTTIILYEVLEAKNPFTLELLPLYNNRGFHGIAKANDAINADYTFRDDVFNTRNYSDGPDLYMKVPGASFQAQRNWYYQVEYPIEAYRGLDSREDLYAHGIFQVNLKKGSKIGIIASVTNPSEKNAFQLFRKEKKRRENLLKDFTSNENIRALALAADQFVVKRGESLKTIIAGYHWFSDWGRDTMISLPGICLVTGRTDDARKILKAFAENVSQGMLPNWFPDRGEQPEYNTVDATLWFFQAIYKYYQYTGDENFVISLLPVLKDIINWHHQGTRYNIHVDTDGLLYAGQDGVQLTWMDAKIGDWVVTPRKGKPVEINALWYNALMITAALLTETGNSAEAIAYYDEAEKVKERFNQLFWNKDQHYLYDYVDGEEKNTEIRPNPLYAISLPFQILDEKYAMAVLETAENHLLTPRGLRSLAPDYSYYRPVYGGDSLSRDSAYHQGTVWSFLLGPYIDALVKLKGEAGKAKATQILNRFFEHLQEGCIGSVSEIFDAEAPHAPRGCVAQAWGVGEILRVAIEHELFQSINQPKSMEFSQI